MKISEVYELSPGKRVKILGWAHRYRDLGEKKFILLRDSTGFIQCVALNNTRIDGKIDVEAFLEITGKLKADKRAPGGLELEAEEIKVLGPSAEDWPFHRYLSVEMEMRYRHLWVRSRKLRAVMKFRDILLASLRKWLKENAFWEVHPPIFVSAACEGGATLFEVNYFGKKAYLSQSAQLYLEALIYSLEKVWSLTPSFRAEKSRTRKHLTEYWHLEAEMALADWKKNMEIQEDLLKAGIAGVKENLPKDVAEVFPDVEARLDSLLDSEWVKISYDEAVELLKRKGVEFRWGDDLGSGEEKILLDHYDAPVFIYRWPLETKVFYMKRDPSDERYVLNNDLLMPGVGEVIGGSQREENLEILLENMKFFNLKPEDYSWYLDLRKYGSVVHSGFGIGVERLVMALMGLEHIRDSLPFPRFINWVWP